MQDLEAVIQRSELWNRELGQEELQMPKNQQPGSPSFLWHRHVLSLLRHVGTRSEERQTWEKRACLGTKGLW